LRAANLTLQAPVEAAAAAPVCCRRNHGVFLSDAYIQLMTPHVRAMLAGPASPAPHNSPSTATSSTSADAVEIVKVLPFFLRLYCTTYCIYYLLPLHPSAPNILLVLNSHPRNLRCSYLCLLSLSHVRLPPKALKFVVRCCTMRAAGAFRSTHVLCRVTSWAVALRHSLLSSGRLL
jgi:hypothetical protein